MYYKAPYRRSLIFCLILRFFLAFLGCSQPLPLLSLLPLSSFSADSSHSDVSTASRSRLFQEDDDLDGSRAGWIADPDSTSLWIQVDLFHSYLATSVATRGRSNQNLWVESYTLQYSVDASTWHAVVDASGSDVTFVANSNDDDIVENTFGPIVARYVRLNVVTWHRSPALRWEVYGWLEG